MPIWRPVNSTVTQGQDWGQCYFIEVVDSRESTATANSQMIQNGTVAKHHRAVIQFKGT